MIKKQWFIWAGIIAVMLILFACGQKPIQQPAKVKFTPETPKPAPPPVKPKPRIDY